VSSFGQVGQVCQETADFAEGERDEAAAMSTCDDSQPCRYGFSAILHQLTGRSGRDGPVPSSRGAGVLSGSRPGGVWFVGTTCSADALVEKGPQ
jgi:hypothetical protein